MKLNAYLKIESLGSVEIRDNVEIGANCCIDKGTISNKENWGLKKLAYPIENKKSGFYHLFQFSSENELVKNLELEFRRDERVMRYLTVKLNKHAQVWAEKRIRRDKAKS